MKRIVVDTSVVVAALRSISGASNALLRLIAKGHMVPLATTALFLEYEDVLKRPQEADCVGDWVLRYAPDFPYSFRHVM